ncbi:S8 family serine peptidase [Alphaproteobacteria bacterium]|nr:S8 family serine peptidase [Alphaproteobacteria bacterium]
MFRPLIKHLFSLSLLLFITSCAGGGGGGGSSSSCGTTCSSGGYSTEYNNQEGLALIGASTANDAGYTGSGVNVAVVDTGIDASHSEFGHLGISGTSFGDGIGYDANTDQNGHGTHVASIIAGRRDGNGMRGVAYDSNLFSYRLYAGSSISFSLSDSVWANMVDTHRSQNIDVSNNSWGSSSIEINEVTTSDITSSYGNAVTAYQNAVSAGTIFVWATGNNGGTQPSWQSGMPYRISGIESGWLAVMAVDHNLQETNYTQRCELAKDWCVAAPGGGLASDESSGVYAAQANGTYVRLSGTSMAAPHVTGLVSTVVDRFPSLSSSDIRNRILNTATYTGLKDTSGRLATSLSQSSRESIFGQGLVTYSAATNVIGSLQYVIGDNYYSSTNSTNLDNERVMIPSFVASNSSIMNDTFTVFDSYDGANFELKGYEIFENNQGPVDNSFLITKDLAIKNINMDNLDKNNFLKLNYVSNGINQSAIHSRDFWDNKISFFSESNLFEKKDLNNFNLGLIDSERFVLNSFIASQDNKSELEADALGVNLITDFNDLSVLTGFSHSNFSLDTSIGGRNTNQNQQINYELGFNYEINNNLDLFYRDNITSLSDVDSSPLNFGLSGAEMNSKTLGVMYDNNFDLIVGFGMYQPQQLVSGDISYYKPIGRNPDGTLYYENVNYSSESSNNFPIYLSIYREMDKDLILNFSVKQSHLDQDRISLGELSLLKQF